jgi:hypothetical protein
MQTEICSLTAVHCSQDFVLIFLENAESQFPTPGGEPLCGLVGRKPRRAEDAFNTFDEVAPGLSRGVRMASPTFRRIQTRVRGNR